MDDKEALRLHLSIRDAIALIKMAVMQIRRQNHYEGMRYLTRAIIHMNRAVEQVMASINWFNQDAEVINGEVLLYNLAAIHEAQKNQDYILMTDLYVLTILPLLNGIQEIIIDRSGGFICDDEKYQRTLEKMQDMPGLKRAYDILKDVDPVDFIISSGIIIEHVMSGYLTMAVLSDDIERSIEKTHMDASGLEGQESQYETVKHYIHSNADIIGESMQLASYWYDDKATEFIIYGLGLGYHVSSLIEIRAYQKIKVYESNLAVIAAAATFGMIEELMRHDDLEVIYDPDFKYINADIINEPKDKLLLVHYPSLYAVSNENEKESLETYFIQYNSVKSQGKFMDGNFRSNIKCFDETADKLADMFHNKDVYIVAGGPSLDKNVMELKRLKDDEVLREKSIILAVGTVYEKLTKLGIAPDYIIASDAKPNTYRQMKGLESQDIPIIGMSTLYYKFFNHYKGKRYIVLQKGYHLAEKMAEELGCMLFESGGSVTTTAIDLTLRLGCGRAVLLGADFAYTEGKSHAADIYSNLDVTDENVIYVKDINGNDVVSGKNLNIYRKWIENRIKDEKSGKVIDATEGGALIRGAKIMKLKDLIQDLQ